MSRTSWSERRLNRQQRVDPPVVIKFSQSLPVNLRRLRPALGAFDEMASQSLDGKNIWWRAVDSEGEVLEILVQLQRDKAAAVRLLRTLVRHQGLRS